MKPIVCTALLLVVCSARAQLQTNRIDAGSFVLDVADGVKLHEGSTLHRAWLVINDTNCPVQLLPTGSTNDDYHYCHLQGTFKVSVPVQSYAVNYILCDSFNQEIKARSVTLSSDYDIDGSYPLPFLFNQTEGTLTCALFVTHARKKDGTIWNCDPDQLRKTLAGCGLQIDALNPERK